MDLFQAKFQVPLAQKLRPTSFDEVIGQEKAKTILRSIKTPISLILYGPPGSGKTTIAAILATEWKLEFKSLSAVTTGVKEIKDISAETDKKGSLVLFLDEIHRFSSAQQDSLLDAVEKGKIILVGATTENPAFRINRALLSRCQIFRLDALDESHLLVLFNKCINYINNLKFTEESKRILLQASGGDARRLFGIIEAIEKLENHPSIVQEEFLQNLLESQVIFYDKNKDYHYDFISAFIKSIRGSDPDAALFYLAGMLEGGEDPIFIMRRLIILASEDIGNASIQALQLAVSGLKALEKIGMPEGRIILSQVVTFLASCPKSNAAYLAFENAKSFFQEKGKNCSIPNHLKNAPTFLHKRESASLGYRYPHDYPKNFVEEFYFPDSLKNQPPQFYYPTENGIEKTLRERLTSIWTKWKKY